MKYFWIYHFVLLLHCAVLTICENYYSIVAPGLIKSNRKYTVTVSLHESRTPCNIRVSISGGSYNKSNETHLQPFESKQLDFYPPKLEDGDYELVAEGTSGCKFKDSGELLVDPGAGPKIYIQTDKAVYKPQDLIQFRIVILDEHTRPVNIREPIRIEIMDGENNRVKQFKDIVLTKGVFTGKYQLSSQPVMGAWTIKVVISGKYSHQNSKKVKVYKYTLPKFSVHIKTPTNLVLEDAHIKAAVYGKYTFDKYVEGNLTIELRNYKKKKLIEKRTMYINGLAVVEFKIENTQELVGVKDIMLEAKLEEKHTGIQQNAYVYIQIHNQRYNIEIPYHEIEFRNNKPFRLKALVQDWNGNAVFDRKTPVIMEHGTKKYETYLDENGVATFEFDHQRDASHKIIFKDSTNTLENIWISDVKKREEDFELHLKEEPRLGKPVEIEVVSKTNIPYLIYNVISHGSLIRMEHIEVPSNKKSYIIRLVPSIEMIPYSYIYVYYIQNGNFKYNEKTFYFPFEFENQISIRAPKQVKPGQEVTLSLEAQPKSLVSILAVDLSVYLLDPSYDLNRKDILSDLANEKSYVAESMITSPGTLSGLITLTNAHHPDLRQELPDHKETFGHMLEFRTKFPETWIFDNFEINDTNTQIKLNIPDTITTWRLTAFSNNVITGFGIVDGPTDITTILPFFITLNLPYSVKSGEIVVIPLVIFNYHNRPLDTEIVLYNEDLEFNFMEPSTNGSQNGNKQTKRKVIPANGGETVTFLIKPIKIGDIKLRIAAINSVYADAVEQKLKVEPEGITKYHNQAVYLSGETVDTFSSNLTVDLPHAIVRGSEFITLSVGSDFMIPTFDNLNELVQMPTGCGEQNMVNLAPNILILQYLKATGKYSREKQLVSEAKYYTEIGYQQQLSYRHKNGGYSVFGAQADSEASTWLTAYVVRFFIKAAKYISIEPRIIVTGLAYLAHEQLIDGSFPYTGYLFFTAHQNDYGFTAFVLLTFMEDHKYSLKYQNTIQKGLQFITSNLDEIDDIYALSIIATTLSQAKHSKANKVLEKLQRYRKNDATNSLLWWTANDKAQEKDVEITAYVLMALLDTTGDHLPILKWLIEQRNEQGGFKSTHDTVVGLQALVKFSKKNNNANNSNLNITYSAEDKQSNEVMMDAFSIKRDNALIHQIHELPKTTNKVNFQVKGSGNSLIQLSYRYNLNDDEEFKHFLIKTKPEIINSDEMNLEICFSYQTQYAISDSTNMIIMEVNLPSGFKSEAESSQDLAENEFIQRVESKNDETAVILYFDKLTAKMQHCVTVEAYKTNEVMTRKPAAIVMYDYYNKSRSNSIFYEI